MIMCLEYAIPAPKGFSSDPAAEVLDERRHTRPCRVPVGRGGLGSDLPKVAKACDAVDADVEPADAGVRGHCSMFDGNVTVARQLRLRCTVELKDRGLRPGHALHPFPLPVLGALCDSLATCRT